MKLIEMHDIITKEEMYWRQQSRKLFQKEGDRNAKYFHMPTLKHRMVKKISRLIVHGVPTDDNEIIKGEAMDFFSNLLEGDPNLDKDKQKLFLDCIPRCISDDQNKFLTAIPSNDEITKAVFSFEGDKDHGPNGFPFLFFHRYWFIIQEDVFNGVKEFFGSRKILKELNVPSSL